jgi:PAS domain S-box-containing protein
MKTVDDAGGGGRPPGEHRSGERRAGDRRREGPGPGASGSSRVPGVAEAPIPGLGREVPSHPRRRRADRRIPTATASAAWAAGIYALAGLIWIYFSDAALLALSPSPEVFALVQTWKGSLFVLATAALLFFLLREQFRRRSQQASRISAADRRLRLQILNSPLALVEFDRELAVRGWSPRAAELFGWSAGEVLGRRLDEIGLVHPADREGTHRRMEEARRDQALGWIHANRNVRKDGSVVHCEWYNAWLRSPTGEEETMISLAQDVTWQQEVLREVRAMNRELEARVQRRTEDLAQVNADLKSLTWSITHDLRAPVRAVSGFAGILERRYAPGLAEEGRTYLGHILEAGAQMDRLIDALLDFGRIEEQAVDLEPVEVSALAASLRSRLFPLLAEADAALDPADLPGLSDPDEKLQIDPRIPPVRADPLLLERVLQNLVDNAVKHRMPGDPLRIRIQGDAPTDTLPGRVRIRVEDDGPGIPPEHRRTLFSLFERLPSAVAVQGSGVGLAVVRRAMERMDGQVWIEDARTLSGAAFVLDLPAADPGGGDPALHPPLEVPSTMQKGPPEAPPA